jgi:DNA-binding response OmpR family regulator
LYKPFEFSELAQRVRSLLDAPAANAIVRNDAAAD